MNICKQLFPLPLSPQSAQKSFTAAALALIAAEAFEITDTQAFSRIFLAETSNTYVGEIPSSPAAPLNPQILPLLPPFLSLPIKFPYMPKIGHMPPKKTKTAYIQPKASRKDPVPFPLAYPKTLFSEKAAAAINKAPKRAAEDKIVPSEKRNETFFSSLFSYAPEAKTETLSASLARFFSFFGGKTDTSLFGALSAPAVIGISDLPDISNIPDLTGSPVIPDISRINDKISFNSLPEKSTLSRSEPRLTRNTPISPASFPFTPPSAYPNPRTAAQPIAKPFPNISFGIAHKAENPLLKNTSILIPTLISSVLSRPEASAEKSRYIYGQNTFTPKFAFSPIKTPSYDVSFINKLNTANFDFLSRYTPLFAEPFISLYGITGGLNFAVNAPNRTISRYSKQTKLLREFYPQNIELAQKKANIPEFKGNKERRNPLYPTLSQGAKDFIPVYSATNGAKKSHYKANFAFFPAEPAFAAQTPFLLDTSPIFRGCSSVLIEKVFFSRKTRRPKPTRCSPQ